MDELIFQVFQVGIIQGVPALEGTIGDASLPLQELGNLGEEVIEGYGGPFPRLAAAVLSSKDDTLSP